MFPDFSFEHFVSRESSQDTRLTGTHASVCSGSMMPSPEVEWEAQVQNALLGHLIVPHRLPAPLLDFTHMDGRLRQQRKYTPLIRLAAAYDEYRRFKWASAFIISFPKCGRTWLRAMLGHFLSEGTHHNVLEVEDICEARSSPKITLTHDDDPHLKSPGDLTVSKEPYRSKDVILLIRDPRDVVVSQFLQFTRRSGHKLAESPPFYGPISEFVFHELGGLPSVVRFYNIWAQNRRVPKTFSLVAYEDLLARPLEEFSRTLRALGIADVGEGRAAAAVNFCSFENMRRLEETNALDDFRLAPQDANDSESFKVRRGKTRGYVDYLSEAVIARMNNYIDQNLDPLYHRYVYKTGAGSR